jgi:toxin ParE1/3/4
VWPVRFSETARAEVIDAQDWHEAEAPGLGRRFRAEIDNVAQRMADNPRQFPEVFKKVRRARATKFPYALFFLVEADAPWAMRRRSKNPNGRRRKEQLSDPVPAGLRQLNETVIRSRRQRLAIPAIHIPT